MALKMRSGVGGADCDVADMGVSDALIFEVGLRRQLYRCGATQGDG